MLFKKSVINLFFRQNLKVEIDFAVLRVLSRLFQMCTMLWYYIVFARWNNHPPHPPSPPPNHEISWTSSNRHKYICFSEALEAGALQKTTRHKTTGARLRPSRVYSRNARNYCCESSRVSLTRQMRLGPKKKPIWRRSGHTEHVCF